tara:strand:+ start:7979 stop:13633 length:5655 start_codon:yes stop_codon:yes gene_type:complete
MKLGLYGGGFKPFHAGHFSKLQLALDQNSKVFLVFGIKKTLYSKKTGKLSSVWWKEQRSFGDPKSAESRRYAQEMQEAIFQIYEEELEKLYPEKLDVIGVMGTAPIKTINSILDEFATMHLTGDIPPPLQIGGASSEIILNDITEINVYAGQDEIATQYVGQMSKRAAAGNPVGQKLIELIDEGVIIFTPEYHPDTPLEFTQIRGTQMRDFLVSGDEEGLRRHLPDLTGDQARDNEIKDKIITVLKTDFVPPDVDPEWTMSESNSPSITNNMLIRASARFRARKRLGETRLSSNRSLKETVSFKGEGGIPGLTEDMNLTFDNLKQLIADVLSGRVEHVEEKLDGQNFTFTVRDGEIRQFGKGVGSSTTTLEKGGSNRQRIEGHPNEKVREAFLSGYDVLEKYLSDQSEDDINSLFQNGKVVVEGQVMTPINPGTIPYTENHFRFIRPSTPYEIDVDMSAYDRIFGDEDVEIQDQAGRTWSFGPAPKLEQTRQDASEIAAKIQELQDDIDNLTQGMDPTPTTVGEYATAAMRDYLDHHAAMLSSMPEDIRTRAIHRLLDKFHRGPESFVEKGGRITSREMGKEYWKEFQKIDKMATNHVVAAIVNLEKIVQKLGSYFFDTIEFALATNQDVVGELAAKVKQIQSAVERDHISARHTETGELRDIVDTEWATRLDASLSRVEQMDLFKKAVEGVVLRLPGPEGEQIAIKLTGMFTPIHRLVSMFKYPTRGEVLSINEPEEVETEEETLTVQESIALNNFLHALTENLLSEGGKAFKHPTEKDEKGKPLVVTSQEKIPRDIANKIIEDVRNNILDPLNLNFVAVGSTCCDPFGRPEGWKPMEEMGDIDILVNVPADMVANTERERRDYRDPDIPGLDKKRKKSRSARKSKIERGLANETPYKDALFVALSNHPYLQQQLVPGVSRVMDGSDGSRIMVEYDGNFYQVDIDLKHPDTAFDDAAWERSGGGQGEAKGLYRNLLMSLIGNKIAEQESNETGQAVKITIGVGAGYTKKINGEVVDRDQDPDSYLKKIGIEQNKSTLRSFNQLVDYMVDNPSPIFDEALQVGPPGEIGPKGYFDDYVAGRPRDPIQNEIAFSYIRQKKAHTISESHLRHIIRNVLLVESAETEASPDEVASGAGAVASGVGKVASGAGAVIAGARAGNIAKLVGKDPSSGKRKSYFYRFLGNIMSMFDKDNSKWSTPPDKWSEEVKIQSLNQDMRAPIQSMLELLRGNNWNYKELGKYHHKNNPMPKPGTPEFKEFVKLAYTPGEGKAFKPKIHSAWRDHQTQAELKAKGTGASVSLHTAVDGKGKPASLAADVIDRRWAWEGSGAPLFWNALRIASNLAGEGYNLHVYLPKDDPAHVAHALYGGGDESSVNSQTMKIMSQLKKEKESNIAEAYLRNIIRKMLIQEDAQSPKSKISPLKVNWSDSLKMFPGIYENKTSATSKGGADDEGAEKAVTISENLIHLSDLEYKIRSDGNTVFFKNKKGETSLGLTAAQDYLLGYTRQVDGLPVPKIAHVPGLEDHDLLMIDGNLKMEVKKMGSTTTLSKLGSASSRYFESNVKILSPIRRAANISQDFLKDKNLIIKSGDKSQISTAAIRDIDGLPESFKVDEIADMLEILNYLFFEIQYSASPKELKGLTTKIRSGQIPHGMVKLVKKSEILIVNGKDVIAMCKDALNSSLGDYSPAIDSDQFTADSVDVTAMVGSGNKEEKEYKGEISLEYFFDELIFKLYDSDDDDESIDREDLQKYADSVEFLASIYPHLHNINNSQNEDTFVKFVDKLSYSGFYGVNAKGYYLLPCSSKELELYGTTQGFRAVLKILKIPTQTVMIPAVKISEDEDIDDKVAEEIIDSFPNIDEYITGEEEEVSSETSTEEIEDVAEEEDEK